MHFYLVIRCCKLVNNQLIGLFILEGHNAEICCFNLLQDEVPLSLKDISLEARLNKWLQRVGT